MKTRARIAVYTALTLAIFLTYVTHQQDRTIALQKAVIRILYWGGR